MTGPRDQKERFWTVPNAISVVRLLGLIPLVWTAYQGQRQAFVWILVLLLLTDWIDGKLAALLDQRTEIGARLDSAADWIMYAAIGVSLWWLEEEVVRQEAIWLAAVAATWALSAIVALVRFGRFPSYHTWGAKTSWFVAGVTALHLFITGDSFAVPWVLGLVVLTNLEEVTVGLALPEWRADVSSLRSALRSRKEEGDPMKNEGH